MLVSIIVCSYNRSEHLCETLTALAGIDVPSGTECELIVVDNNSTDGTRDMVQATQMPNMSLRYVFEPTRGQNNAYNTALHLAQGEILLFTDDDVRPPKNWIAAMTEPIMQGEADAVSGGVKLAPHLYRDWMSDIHKAFLAENIHKPISSGILVGANMVFSRKVLERVPQFDTEIGPGLLGFGGDSLFDWQLRDAGYRIVFRPDIIVEHHPQVERLSRESFLDSAKKDGQTGGFLMRHWDKKNILFPKARLSIKYLQITLWRLLHLKELKRTEGVAPAELYHMRGFWLYRQYIQELKRPRKYPL